MGDSDTKWDSEYYNNLLKVYNKEELALMHTHSNMREYGYKKVQDKLTKQNKILLEALNRAKYPCTDCRFYSDCDRKGVCRTRTNFEIEQALKSLEED